MLVSRRCYYEKIVTKTDGYGKKHVESKREEVPMADANLIGSLSTVDGLHMPVLDIDYDATLLPSSTAGHYHLYLNKLCSWRQYKKFLKAMADAGLIEKGYVKASLGRKQTFVRKRGVRKTREEFYNEAMATS